MDNRYSENGERSHVEAIYKEPLYNAGNKKIFIEAIPHPILDESERFRFYSKKLLDFDSYHKSSDEEKIIQLNELYKIRFYLPFMADLEKRFYSSLVTSYMERDMVVDSTSQMYKTVSSTGAGTNPGFSLIGPSGCGKSSAFKMLLSHYPQVIVHETDKGKCIQILYLVVTCFPNSNFDALYSAIAKKIDEALNTDIYRDLMNKEKSLGRKQLRLVDWIEKFNIGMIIFDEIQLIDFSVTKENSFESLMTIANQTKIAMAIIGTEDSYGKMFVNLRTIRRIGTNIPVSNYCQNKKYVFKIIQGLFNYQLFSKKVEATEDILEAFYKETQGVISLIVMLYISIQEDYLSKRNKPVIDAKYVSNIMKKNFPELRKKLSEINIADQENDLYSYINDASDMLERKLEIARQNAEMENIKQNIKSLDIGPILKQIKLSMEAKTNEFSTDEIEKKAKEIIGDADIKELDINKLANDTYLALSKTMKKRAKASK